MNQDSQAKNRKNFDDAMSKILKAGRVTNEEMKKKNQKPEKKDWFFRLGVLNI